MTGRPGYHSAVSAQFLLVIGGGNMARALVLGCVERGVMRAEQFVVVEPAAAARSAFAEAGVRAVGSLGEVSGAWGAKIHDATQVLLAVKPQSLGGVSAQWTAAGFSGFGGVAVTILAGTPSTEVRAALGGSARVIRAMPNTPARIGQGATAVALGTGAHPGDEALALTLFRGVGPVVEMVPEAAMDAVTAVSGSGPAYLFYLAEAMIRGAVEAGLADDAADRLVRQTLLGSASLLKLSPGESPASLRTAVTSKGGTTEAAVGVLEKASVSEAVRGAIVAATARGHELAGG